MKNCIRSISLYLALILFSSICNAQVVVLFEPFEHGKLPRGWQAYIEEGGEPWKFNNPRGVENLTGGQGLFAESFWYVEALGYGHLRTPRYDLSNFSSVTLSFDFYSPLPAPPGFFAFCVGVTNNTGSYVPSCITRGTGPFHSEADISQWAAGFSDVRINFISFVQSLDGVDPMIYQLDNVMLVGY